MTVRSAVARVGRGARRVAARGRARPLLVAALVGIVAVVLTLTWRQDEHHGDLGSGVGGGSTIRVGVSDGDSVPAYLVAQRSELARLVAQSPARPVYALVSFDVYLTPSQVAAATAGDPGASPVYPVATIAAYARVPLPRRQTELVRLPANRMPDDIVSGMAVVADRKAAQAATYTTRAGQDDASRTLFESIGAVAGQEATAYRAGCACVYALVVRATPVALAALGAGVRVRVVDAAPELTEVASAVFVAPLPEQIDVVRPLPGGDRGSLAQMCVGARCVVLVAATCSKVDQRGGGKRLGSP